MKLWSLFVVVWFAAALAYAESTKPNTPLCAVQVEVTLHSSTGPIVIDNACLSQPGVYADGVLVLDIVDNGDSIFANGFDPD